MGGRRLPVEPQAGDAMAWLAVRDADGRFPFAPLAEHPEWAALIPSIKRAGGDVAAALPRLAQYIAAVLQWNRTVSNLISRSDEARLVSRHLAESIEPAGWLKEFGSQRWVDLGSGAGFPALPLAIIGVGSKWLLVESRRPKTLFLKKLTQDLGLTDIHIAHARLEELVHGDDLGDPHPEALRAGGFPFDALTSRATMTLPPTLEIAEACVRPGGHAFLWKGSARVREKAENSAWNERWDESGELVLDEGNVAVCNFILRR